MTRMISNTEEKNGPVAIVWMKDAAPEPADVPREDSRIDSIECFL
jgi:hypothetical protein